MPWPNCQSPATEAAGRDARFQKGVVLQRCCSSEPCCAASRCRSVASHFPGPPAASPVRGHCELDVPAIGIDSQANGRSALAGCPPELPPQASCTISPPRV
mmetsp:Transcript_9254/g.25949  ORF Transcript_9254/g.25949 Transcript_9254/m.25949 type:complete len:101 (-) Transcript_9254:1040-1342(-)